MAETLAGRCVADFTTVGVDLSSRMLAVARDKFECAGFRFAPVHSDLERLPLPDSAFDYVLSAHAIEHSARPLRALAEAERVLAPGGTLIIMMTRCNPATTRLRRRWAVQCGRSRKLATVLRDFGLHEVHSVAYPNSPVCNWLSFCLVAGKHARDDHEFIKANQGSTTSPVGQSFRRRSRN